MHYQSVNPCRVSSSPSFSLSSSILSSLLSLSFVLSSLSLFSSLSVFFLFSQCGVWCVVCVRPKRHHVYRHHAHMLKHMCAWCRYTRRRVEWTHGREGRGGSEGGEEGNRHQPRVFNRKTSECLTCLEHLNRMLGSSLIANFLLAMNGPHRFITCFRSSPKVTLNLTHLKFENRSGTTCSRFL